MKMYSIFQKKVFLEEQMKKHYWVPEKCVSCATIFDVKCGNVCETYKVCFRQPNYYNSTVHERLHFIRSVRLYDYIFIYPLSTMMTTPRRPPTTQYTQFRFESTFDFYLPLMLFLFLFLTFSHYLVLFCYWFVKRKYTFAQTHIRTNISKFHKIAQEQKQPWYNIHQILLQPVHIQFEVWKVNTCSAA